MGKVLMLALCYAYRESYESTRRACLFLEGDTIPSSATIARWFGFFRECVAATVPRHPQEGGKLGGDGKIVQVDECQIVRRKYNRGKVLPGSDIWILGLKDSDGLIRLEVCEKRNRANLERLIRKWVRVGSTIHTDEWAGYRGLSGLGYIHRTVNHSREFVAGDGAHTQSIESEWRALRRTTSPGGVRRKHMPEKLFEYVWRTENRRQGRDPFGELLKLLKIVEN